MPSTFLSLWILALSTLSALTVNAQSVYFQRFPAGTVSSVSPLGPATTLTDLAGNLSNARLGGVDSNGAGLIFYTDRAANQILAVDATMNVYVVLLPFSGLSNPQAISLDITGNFLYIADTGNDRIVRVNLSVPLPTNKVQVVVDASAGVTGEVVDLKYNPSDGFLYWTNGGAFHRTEVRGRPVPVESGETLLTANSIGVGFFDFDSASPQNVFFSSGSGGFEGIFHALVPRSGDTPQLSERNVLNTSSNPDITISGIAIDKNGPFFCYTASNTPAPVLRCGDRTTTDVANFSEILSGEFSNAPNFLVIDSPSNVVSPQTRLPAPILQLNLAIPKPEVLILLRQFDVAVLNSIRKILERATSGRIGFQYSVEINKTGDENGNSISNANRDRRNRIAMRNIVTAKNLKPNSTYQVRYNIQITQKKKGQPMKVVKNTPLSPFSSFVIPKRGAS